MSPAIDQHPQLKYPPRPMTRKGEHLMCLSPEGRYYVDRVVQAECRGKYLELSGSIKHKLAVETGVSFAQIQNYLRNKHQSIRNAQASPTFSASTSLPAVPSISHYSSLRSVSVKPPPENARRAEELLLFADIPEAKLDRLHGLLHLYPDANEERAQTWADPLELPENRVLAWLRYQRNSGASQSPPPPKYEDVDELSTPKTLVKQELSPEPTVSDRSNSRDADSPPETDMEMDEDQQAEIREVERPLSEQRFVLPAQTPSLPSLNQLPTPADSSSTSPIPSDAGQSFAEQQESIRSPDLMQVTNSQCGLSAAPRGAQPGLEDGEILTEGGHRLAGSSSSPTVGPVATTSRDLAHSSGDRTGNSFPVLTPLEQHSSPDVPIASPMQHSSSREGAPSRHNSWDDSRNSSRGDSSRRQHPSLRNAPPSPQTGDGKGKAREVFEAVDEARQGPRFVEQHGVGPHRDRPRPSKLYTHPYRVHLPSSSSHRDRPPSSASISYATTPSTSRSLTSPSTANMSASPPCRGTDGCRIVQAVTMALREMPAPSPRMDVDSHDDGATFSTQDNVRKILEINSWALGAAKSLGVSLEGFPSRGNMPPPPNPLSSPNFRK